jgi:hypothetical protein
VNKNENNIALPNIYPQVTLNPKPTHSKKYCFSSTHPPPPNHLQVATSRIKVFILNNIQVKKKNKHKHERQLRRRKNVSRCALQI